MSFTRHSFCNMWLMSFEKSRKRTGYACVFQLEENLFFTLSPCPMNKQKEIIFSILLLLIGSLAGFATGGQMPVDKEKVMKQRFADMQTVINPVWHPTVEEYIVSYTTRARIDTRYLVGKTTVYFPIFEHYLDLYGLPRDLKYIAAWESKLDPTARSHAGAAGLWQMMPATGRKYGLTINKSTDERLDPQKSTEAAVLYLSDLYDILGDWTLVAAAYNCGEGRIIKAVKTGGSKDYWQLRRYLPRETLDYVPAILATTYAVQYYNFYNIRPRYPDYTSQNLRTTVLYYGITFREITKMTGISKKELAALNPSYLQGIIPANRNGNYLRLPEKAAGRFRDIWSSKKRTRKVQAAAAYNPNTQAAYPVLCVVKPGDTLDYLSDLYRVPVKKIINKNNLQTNRLTVFQELYIEIPVRNMSNVKVKN